jgi:hypothetical protein
LLLFNWEGGCLAAKLRPGNVHSAEGWEELLLPGIEDQQQMEKEVACRADAGFAKPEVYEALEKRGVKYAIRILATDILHDGAVDQGRKAGGEDDANQLPSVPVERDAAVADDHRL